VGFVVDKVALKHVSYNYFGFPCHSFHRLLHAHLYPSSGEGAIGQTVADLPSGLSCISPQELILLLIALQLFVVSWKYFHSLDPIHSRQDSLDWESAYRKFATDTQDNTNTK
jgi:hypothetical protein